MVRSLLLICILSFQIIHNNCKKIDKTIIYFLPFDKQYLVEIDCNTIKQMGEDIQIKEIADRKLSNYMYSNICSVKYHEISKELKTIDGRLLIEFFIDSKKEVVCFDKFGNLL